MERLERGAVRLLSELGMSIPGGNSTVAFAVLLLAALLLFALGTTGVVLFVRLKRNRGTAKPRRRRLPTLTNGTSGVAKTLRRAGFGSVQLIGEGGIGEVFRARHPSEPLICAVKVLKPKFLGDPEVVKHFLYEGQILTRLGELAARTWGQTGSPFLHCYTYGYLGELPYLQLEYIEGTDLEAVLSAHPRGLDPLHALRIAGRMAEALGVAHSIDVYHRDVAPDNVLFHCEPGSSRILVSNLRLIDFGVAKIKQRQTVAGAIWGKPVYMSPEQIAHRRLDGRTDIYSLGVVLYQMLSGRVPFDGDMLSVMRMHEEAPVPPLPASIPAELRELVEKGMLAKSPEVRRPQTMSECAVALHRFSR